jgi:hypothetical protein
MKEKVAEHYLVDQLQKPFRPQTWNGNVPSCVMCDKKLYAAGSPYSRMVCFLSDRLETNDLGYLLHSY